jgi:hypothetical protein
MPTHIGSRVAHKSGEWNGPKVVDRLRSRRDASPERLPHDGRARPSRLAQQLVQRNRADLWHRQRRQAVNCFRHLAQRATVEHRYVDTPPREQMQAVIELPS